MEQVEKFNQIIDEVYEQYWNSVETSEYDGFGSTLIKLPTLSQEQFINKCKTDLDFSQKWGLKIEERELTTKERMNLCEKFSNQHNLFPLLWRVDGNGFMYDEIEKTIDRTCWNIPTKLITLTYKNKQLETYE